VHYSTSTPSEKPVTSKTYHSTAVGNQPKYIRLPSIGAEGYIQAVGLDQNGAVAAPNNVSLAGWYANMLAPGQSGLSIIDGHVDGKTTRGIFYDLHKLAAGDAFEVDLANGQVVHFAVKSVRQVAVSDAASQLFARDNDIAGQLNLITCGGTFNHAKGVYNDRVIVVAAQTR
jgi:LPXTG-site transpeptidase (sortase) family protein